MLQVATAASYNQRLKIRYLNVYSVNIWWKRF